MDYGLFSTSRLEKIYGKTGSATSNCMVDRKTLLFPSACGMFFKSSGLLIFLVSADFGYPTWRQYTKAHAIDDLENLGKEIEAAKIRLRVDGHHSLESLERDIDQAIRNN
ncbi:hypothetical protein TNCV_1290481 [Trichonephila clavipes]|nr:hypothetical protein TNCV_1290481 [Trichonephila clavipes]